MNGNILIRLERMSIRFIPTKVHAILDYMIAGLVILSPWIFNFEGIAMISSFVSGAGILAYSAITDYEFGVIKKISTSQHFQLDGYTGAFIVVSPFIFNFYNDVFIPHLILGSVILFISLITHVYPDYIKKASLVKRIYKTYF